MAGKYFEDLEVGAVLKHSRGRTITEMDNVLFSALTMNTQPLHLNEDFARNSQFGQRLVNGIFTLGLAIGLTVPDLTEGTLIANLNYENVKYPQPLFHGDTLYVETEVLSKRESNSKSDQGIVRFRHLGRNQNKVIVIEFERTVLLQRRVMKSASVETALQRSEQLRRSVLFVPGDSLRKISKAVQLEADSIILDLEDGVAFNRKEEARRTVVEALGTVEFGPRERLIRINPLTSLHPTELEKLPAADLQATIFSRPAGYVIPKVETPDHIRIVSNYLDKVENERNWPLRAIRLLAMIETAKGVLNVGQIAQASPRLEALIFGAEDLASDMGARRTAASWEVFYARSALITAAAAYGLQAIDMVFLDLNDLSGLEEECRLARQLGFSGKTAIHPRQIEIMNRLFAPSPEEIEQALWLSQAFEAHQAAGTGAFELDGKMVDLPLMRRAEQVLARARAAGLLA
jgi:citrate lyase beta subunit/acyl dehydratase